MAKHTHGQAFWRSLCAHPGLTIGALWPFLLLGAIASRKDFTGFAAFSGAAWYGLSAIAALPWIPILWTAWTRRHQYKASPSQAQESGNGK